MTANSASLGIPQRVLVFSIAASTFQKPFLSSKVNAAATPKAFRARVSPVAAVARVAAAAEMVAVGAAPAALVVVVAVDEGAAGVAPAAAAIRAPAQRQRSS